MLEKLFNPESIALIGATYGQLSVGANVLLNLLTNGFEGRLYPINPKYQEIYGIKCYPDLRSLPEIPDLAFIMTNHIKAVEVLKECAQLGIKNAIIIAGGYREYSEGKNLEKELKKICSKYGINLLGPNTLGFANVKRNIFAIFWYLKAKPGKVSLISQSGGVGLTIAHLLYEEGIGIAKWIGAGNRTVLEFADYMEYLKEDPDTQIIALFIEGTEEGRRLFETAKSITPYKPIIAYKVGKTEEINRAAQTHTGSLAGKREIYSAAFKQAGIIEAHSPREIVLIIKALYMLKPPVDNKICILTYTAGPSIVAMDLLIEKGWFISPLEKSLKESIYQIIGNKTPVDIGNPVDLTGPGFIPETFIPVADTLLKDSNFSCYLFIWSYNPNIRVPVAELINLKKRYHKPFAFLLLGPREDLNNEREKLESKGIPVFFTPEDAAIALGGLLERGKFLKKLNNHVSK